MEPAGLPCKQMYSRPKGGEGSAISKVMIVSSSVHEPKESTLKFAKFGITQVFQENNAPTFEFGHVLDDFKISKPESMKPSESVPVFGHATCKSGTSGAVDVLQGTHSPIFSPKGGEISQSKNEKPSKFLEMQIKNHDAKSSCLKKTHMIPIQTCLSQGQCLKSESVDLTEVGAEVKPIDPNRCNWKSDHCNSPENNCKMFTQGHLNSIPKIAELQGYKIVSKRKAWAIRDFPDGCGRRVPDAKKLRISKVCIDVKTSAGFIKTAKQEEKPASTIIMKSANRKQNDLQGTSKKYNMLVKSKHRIRKLSVRNEMSTGYTLSQASQLTDANIRERVKKTLCLFQFFCRRLLQEKESQLVDCKKMDTVLGERNRVDLKAFGLLKKKGMWLAEGQQWVGNVPGIEVGDEFHYRVELCLTGIHKPTMAGIDFKKIDGRAVATSIVSSGMYSDIMDGSDVLVYEGEGGGFQTSKSRQKPHPGDQKLVRGNLALVNSIDTQLPVRVILGVKEQKPRETHGGIAKVVSTYVYDGLYKVEKYWSEIGKKGYSVFKFRLRRIPNQPQIPLKEIMMLKQSKTRIGLCVDDISHGREKKPIAAVNTIDNELPPPFTYIRRVRYPSCYKRRQPQGCDCIGECIDPRICQCAAKNGGDFPFNHDGAIVRAKRLVYECGPSCRCSASCYNRVSQHGIKFQLEIFKTELRGWGVRSLASIPSGSFVCEYTGEVLQDSEAQERGCDEYLFAIGNNYNDEKLWQGLSTFIPGLQKDDPGDDVNDTGSTIDAEKYGGVGRFINHGCAPNLYAQNVLYDHDDKSVPHIMLFASENIPPLKELTYHYNYVIDQVHDLKGNIKKKACHCGAVSCSGRLY